MTVKSLSKILAQLDPEMEVLMEYCPRAHEYLMEPVLGVRSEVDRNAAVILAMGILAEDDEIGEIPTIPQ